MREMDRRMVAIILTFLIVFGTWPIQIGLYGAHGQIEPFPQTIS